MPSVNVRYTGNPFGMASYTEGLNDQYGFWATNNSGSYLAHGDVVIIDSTTALDTHETDVNGAATLTQASQTLTVDDTTGFASSGNLLVAATPVGNAVSAANTVAVFVSYTGVTGTTYTGSTAYAASAASGLADEAIVVVPPMTLVTAPSSTGFSAGFATAPADGGRYVTLAGVSKSASVCGVVSVTGDAGTATYGQMGNAMGPTPWAGYTGGATPVVPPGGTCFIVTGGVARVKVNGLTVAAAGLLATATIPGTADDTPATIGNLLGVALEANTAKDANNTIRALIKIT